MDFPNISQRTISLNSLAWYHPSELTFLYYQIHFGKCWYREKSFVLGNKFCGFFETQNVVINQDLPSVRIGKLTAPSPHHCNP